MTFWKWKCSDELVSRLITNDEFIKSTLLVSFVELFVLIPINTSLRFNNVLNDINIHSV